MLFKHRAKKEKHQINVQTGNRLDTDLEGGSGSDDKKFGNVEEDEFREWNPECGQLEVSDRGSY